ncbi:TetR/AcrR family transcriptional regulator [Enterococcus ureasiticus]|uniref:TetR/AcrR family transcriptional regulator n=1 Tax=Enterococcus ureasiticus TaxID=903984 RepID=UPI001F5FC76D|nr:TetR/AcrR family transcriptional regulator [Enterococcus ureasiticus]
MKKTIQDIVNELDGLSRGTIYHHFRWRSEKAYPNTAYFDVISERTDFTGIQKMKHLLLETLFNKEVGGHSS